MIQVNGAAINSNGGNITLGGGTDPSTNLAIGLDSPITNPAILNQRVGVRITNAQINAGTGNLIINGQANLSPTAPAQVARGIQITDSTLQVTGAGNITLKGTGLLDGVRAGRPSDVSNSGIVSFNSTIRQISGSGTITLNGIANNNNNGIQLGEVGSIATSLIESTGTGGIILNGISAPNNPNATAINIFPNTTSIIRSRNGEIQLTGNSRTTLRGAIASTGRGSVTVIETGQNGILLNTPGTSLTTEGGNINLNANNSPLTIGNTIVATNGGNFTGIGRGNATTSVGVQFSSNSTIDVGGGGITLIGTGSNTAASNTGIGIGGQSVLRATGSRSISMTGIAGSGAGGDNHGIQIVDSSIQAKGKSSIALTGIAGNGGDSNHGIQILGSIFRDISHISSVDGDIILNGTGGGGTGNGNVGIFLKDLGRVESTGRGNITLLGKGGGTISFVGSNHGIEIGQTNGNARIRSVNGNITLRGRAENGTGSGVLIYSLGPTGSFVNSTGAGNIVLEGISKSFTGTLIQGSSGASGVSRVDAAVGNVAIIGTGGKGSSGIRVSNGSINLNKNTGGLTLTGNAVFENSLDLKANRIAIGNISSSGQPISLSSNSTLLTESLR